jgi:hypothetical protein
MDNADAAYVDGVVPAQCFGQLFCGQCKPQFEANVTNCPNVGHHSVCRPGVARLLELLERTPGRHTPTAQFNLGMMYGNGKGVPQDYSKAVKWYRLAADQGFADAHLNLGLMYAQGRGVVQGYTEAVKWYRLAADQEHASAQSNLGVMHANGAGVPQDFTKAARLFKLAAKQGGANAISGLRRARY